MNEKLVNWGDLQVFIAVAEQGGLSAAARVTQSSPATLGRRMLALEKAMKSSLFIRHERGYELTTDGKELLKRAKEISNQITDFSRHTDTNAPPLITISAGTWTSLNLMHQIDKISGSPTDTRLRFISSEAVFSIRHREILIGIRNAPPKDPSLVQKKLGCVEFALFSHKNPISKQWIMVENETPSSKWMKANMPHRAIFEVTSARNALDLVLAGHGVALLPTFIGKRIHELKSQSEIIEPLSHHQWLVTHGEERHRPEVRKVLKRLESLL